MESLKQFQDKLNGLISGIPADGSATGGSLTWAKDGVQYSLSLSISGGSITTSFSAYKPEPPSTPPNSAA